MERNTKWLRVVASECAACARSERIEFVDYKCEDHGPPVAPLRLAWPWQRAPRWLRAVRWTCVAVYAGSIIASACLRFWWQALFNAAQIAAWLWLWASPRSQKTDDYGR
jgi:hypothetical protein